MGFSAFVFNQRLLHVSEAQEGLTLRKAVHKACMHTCIFVRPVVAG